VDIILAEASITNDELEEDQLQKKCTISKIINSSRKEIQNARWKVVKEWNKVILQN
jgi:hypothetical protein